MIREIIIGLGVILIRTCVILAFLFIMAVIITLILQAIFGGSGFFLLGHKW